MPARTAPLATGEIYHVFNRSIDRQPIFTRQKANKRAILTLSYYRFIKTPIKLSHFLTWSSDKKILILDQLEQQSLRFVTVLAYCLMPNHYHLLLKQEQEQGISKFVGQFQNSYTRYFNTFQNRVGHLFQGQFKAVHVETDEQLLHVSRYIHLNPYTSFVVKTLDDLLVYPWSSLFEYLSGPAKISKPAQILEYFKNPTTYEQFIKDQADYQRELEKIKHLAIDS